MTNERFDAHLFGGPPRHPDELLTQRHMDLAASIQAVTEEVVLRLTRGIADETGAKNLCLAGGVALNCVANGKMLRDGVFETCLDPARGGRCRRRARGCARGLSPAPGPPRPRPTRRRMRAPISARHLPRKPKSSVASPTPARCSMVLDEPALLDATTPMR
jgi:hypothetical protein